jgi:hypothetical protein
VNLPPPPPAGTGSANGTGAHDTGATHPDYGLLNGLLKQLPPDGKWTKARRDKWIQAMTASVDLLVDVVHPPAPEAQQSALALGVP